jgi:hypothetical protein
MEQFRKSFSKFDNLSGERGQVKALELVAILDDLGMKMNADEVSRAISAVDHDSNLFLNFPEFVRLLKNVAERQYFLTGECVQFFSYEGFAKMNFTGLSSSAAKQKTQMINLQAKIDLLLSRS